MTPPLFSFVKGELWPSFEDCPFALWVAFPTSDYYGGSVAVGLASRRRSRIPVYETLSTCRCPFVPCQTHCLLLTGESLVPVKNTLADCR